MFTHFYDMSSGGSQKTDYKHIFIEADERAAAEEFQRRFSRDPENVTCTCCGSDFSVMTDESLSELTDYWRKDMPLDEFLKSDGVLFVPAAEVE